MSIAPSTRAATGLHSSSSDTAHGSAKVRRLFWAMLGALGGALCSAALFAGAGQIQLVLLDHAWQTAAAAAPSQRAFGLLPDSKFVRARVLGGVSGEIFAPGAEGRGAAVSGNNISPVAWDRLSAGNCITLTTQSGQMLSFRIVGTRAAGDQKDMNTLPEIDLAVTACSGAGEPVAKAVIEPAKPPVEDAVAQRTL